VKYPKANTDRGQPQFSRAGISGGELRAGKPDQFLVGIGVTGAIR